jgi:hypothetical protein
MNLGADLLCGAPSMGAISRVKVPNGEGGSSH